MASINSICRKLLNVKNIVVESQKVYDDADGIKHLSIQVRPSKRHQCRCPLCGRKCVKDGASAQHRTWRHMDFGGIIVEVESDTQRIRCPEHGSIVADVPWAYPGSRFTKAFDMTVGWLAVHLPKSVISELMRIDWKTVGRCVSRTLNDIEPDRRKRLDGLVHIGIDETSYQKGHKYITVVLNHDTNTVVWAAQGHGKGVLEQFYKQLTPKQLSSIEVVSGDGARWITDCVNEFTPNCERCIDSFHVVEWAMEALDEVRREAWHEARAKAEQAKERCSARQKKWGDEAADKAAAKARADAVKQAQEKAGQIKGSAYALGKAPENLTETQKLKLAFIEQENPRLYRAYRLKEGLRMILKMTSVEDAAAELKRWLWKASHSQIPQMHDLYEKIKRHEEHILNTIRLGLSNARIEAANNKIKLVIRKAYGFRNIQNLLDMVYLVCSNLVIPLPNRKPKPPMPCVS